MNDFAERYVAHVLEDEVAPGAGEPPAEAPAPAPERGPRQKWDDAHTTFQKLWDLTLQKQKTMSELGRSIAYNRALAHVDLTRNDVQATIRADDVYETTPLPAGHPLQNIRRRFAKKYPNAIVGVQTKDGREVFFNEPLPPEYGPVITYEQFSAIEKAREARERGTRGW